MIKSFGYGKDKDTIEKIFWVLDKDGSGKLEYIELVLGVQMMRQSLLQPTLLQNTRKSSAGQWAQNSLKEKLITFFDMCDLDGNGYVEKGEFALIKKGLNYNNSGKQIGIVINKLFDVIDTNRDGKISRDELIQAIESNQFTKIVKPFNLGVYFKQYQSLIEVQASDTGNMSKILRAFEEKERIKDDVQKFVQNNTKNYFF